MKLTADASLLPSLPCCKFVDQNKGLLERSPLPPSLAPQTDTNPLSLSQRGKNGMLLELEEPPPPLMDGWMRIATGQIQWHILDLT